ncbi:alpha/beta fold hydrolase [Streptomyces sp. NBC_00056]|uniref:alpha/beta fold hydrolase n=1 Tax=Streptomyces sp. NBC_00056 TaxID=2975633 RepID=UPI00386752D4
MLLLHGFPSSSHMFRHLVPALADDYHVIATDHIGYGHSAMPKVDAFDYTLDNLAGITAGLLNQLGMNRFAMYVHDYGAPIGWRLALDPSFDVSAIISQSGNAYMEGFAKPFWDDLFAYATNPGRDTEPGLAGLLVEVVELGIAVRVLTALDGLGVGMQAEAFLP